MVREIDCVPGGGGDGSRECGPDARDGAGAIAQHRCLGCAGRRVAAARGWQGRAATGAFRAAPRPAGNVSDVPLKIEEAVAMALEKNLDIAVERLNPSSFDFSLEALRATFNPTATSTVGYNSTYQLPTSQLVGGARVKNDQATWNFGLQQLLPWWGGSYQVQFNSRRNDNNNAFVTFNPQYNTLLSASFVQPLLRGRADRQHPHGADHHADQPRTLRRAGPDDGHRDAGRRAQRLLGPGLRPGSRQRREALAATGREAGRGQPGARRSRHAGADRRRPGPGRSGDAPADAGRPRGAGPDG